MGQVFSFIVDCKPAKEQQGETQKWRSEGCFYTLKSPLATVSLCSPPFGPSPS